MQCAERTASVAGLELPSLFNGFVGSCGLHINPSTEFYVKKATFRCRVCCLECMQAADR